MLHAGEVFDERLVNIRWKNDEDGTAFVPAPLALTNNPGHGTSGRYEMDAQRRGDGGPVAVVRITDHETNRRLTICGNGGSNDSNVSTPTHRIIGHDAGQALHSKTYERTHAAIARLFDLAYGPGLRRTHPAQRATELMFIATGVPHDEIDRWLDHPGWAEYLLTNSRDTEAVGVLAATGVDPHEAYQFLAAAYAVFSPARAERGEYDFRMTRPVAAHIGRLILAGLDGKTAAEIADFANAASASPSVFKSISLIDTANVGTAWLRVPADLRPLVLLAGLTAIEAARLARRGELDVETLRFMAGMATPSVQ